MPQHSFNPSVSMAKGSKLVSAKDLFFLRVILINVFLWMALWNLAENVVEYIEDNTGIPEFYLYIFIIFICLALILTDVEIFEKF